MDVTVVLTGGYSIPKSKPKIAIGIIIALAATGLLYYSSIPSAPEAKPVFIGDSTDLEATDIIATLDAPFDQEKNTIWCASFLAAWKTLETDITKEPVTLRGDPEIALALNNAADPHRTIPTESLYTAAGWIDEGIIPKIRKDLSRKFPGKAPTQLATDPNATFIAYAYLQAEVEFDLPYYQNREPLPFTDSTGQKTDLSSFGLTRFAFGLNKHLLAGQPAVLFAAKNQDFDLTEFAIDLDRSSTPNQIILAMVDPASTLQQTLDKINKKIATSDIEEDYNSLSSDETMVIPDMVWDIQHQFDELTGREFTNANLAKRVIAIARQDIQFRLDRNGAELKSEVDITDSAASESPNHYIFDRPFLLYMKKRGEATPYFVMWIANAELLNKWTQD